MSASTFSITANPAEAIRRRAVVADRRRPSANNIDLFPAESPQIKGETAATAADNDNNVATGTDKLALTAAHSRDPSHHSIHGDANLERTPKDLVHLKKTMNNSTVSPRRARKPAAAGKAEKPWWLTVVSVITKNFLLLLVILGLMQMIRTLMVRNEIDKGGAELGISEFELRIAEVEALLKETTKWTQVEVDVVDKKIENEIGGLRREMGKRIDDKIFSFESELEKLVVKSEGLQKEVKEWNPGNWVSKEEFERVYKELKRGKEWIGGEHVGLDEIRAYAREMVEREIEKHAADGLGRVDYALAAGGGFVLKHSEPFLVHGRGRNWLLNGGKRGVHSDADKMLKPSFGEPGQCFPLKGSSGFVEIRLRTAIVPEAVTLEHVAKSVAYDRSTAPKDCRVSGWLQGNDVDLHVVSEKMFLLTEFTYDLEKSNAQTFNVLDSMGSGLVDTVRLDFVTNHGNPSLTCIYRFRVHGYEAEPVSLMAMRS